jgi:hypothetical protein
MTRAAVGRGVVAASVLALAVFLWGGYAAGWSWTGLSGDVALWDWLEALALPVTVGLLPVLLLHRDRLRGRPRIILVAASAAFVALVLAGYLVPWEWTGFTGNTLWDWLELALLPVVLATATFWPAPDELDRRHWTLIAVGGAAFLVVVLAGYLVPWGWTGFSDNKVWDWLKLLLLPVLVPTVLLPALQHLLEDTTAEPTGSITTPSSPRSASTE